MLKLMYVFGAQDSTIKIDPSLITGDYDTDRSNSTLQALSAGKGVTIDTDGYVTLPSAGEAIEGVIINDVVGYSFENAPAFASGICPILSGGGIVETDALASDTSGVAVSATTTLYIDADGNFTKTDPGSGIPVAKVRKPKADTDTSVVIRLY